MSSVGSGVDDSYLYHLVTSPNKGIVGLCFGAFCKNSLQIHYIVLRL